MPKVGKVTFKSLRGHLQSQTLWLNSASQYLCGLLWPVRVQHAHPKAHAKETLWEFIRGEAVLLTVRALRLTVELPCSQSVKALTTSAFPL